MINNMVTLIIDKNDCNDIIRWAPDKSMDKQPNYLKFVFKFILDVFKEFEKKVGSEGRSYSVKSTVEEVTNNS